MQAHQTNSIIIDVRQPIGPGLSNRSINHLVDGQGVSRAWAGKKSRGILLVDYEPETTAASTILGSVDRQSLDAKLIRS